MLSLCYEDVSDLSCLRNMPLTQLDIEGTKVRDLSPLRGMRLTSLELCGTEVADLSPLAGMPLTNLSFSTESIKEGMNAIRSMSSLQKINWRTPRRFWAEQDIREKLRERGLTDSEFTLHENFLSNIFDGKDDLVVTLMGLTDISPLKGMSLSLLDFHCCPDLRDLSPLKGMPLTKLDISETDVSDLSPLTGMPLVKLDMEHTEAADLTPLKGMSLTYLDISGSRVKDVSPLKGMPIEELDAGWLMELEDLSPLKGMPIRNLDICETQVSDLTPLQGMPLRFLDIWVTKVTDLTPLRGLNLSVLQMGQNDITDLSPLQDMPLTELNAGATLVSDLNPLKGMPLKKLNVHGTRVQDLSPLRGLPIENLSLGHLQTDIDLSPLMDVPLSDLDLWNSPVTDLSPLSGMRLRHIRIQGTRVTDLSPLRGMPLTSISLDTDMIAKGIEVLRKMDGLSINWSDSRNFWEEYDRRKKGKAVRLTVRLSGDSSLRNREIIIASKTWQKEFEVNEDGAFVTYVPKNGTYWIGYRQFNNFKKWLKTVDISGDTDLDIPFDEPCLEISFKNIPDLYRTNNGMIYLRHLGSSTGIGVQRLSDRHRFGFLDKPDMFVEGTNTILLKIDGDKRLFTWTATVKPDTQQEIVLDFNDAKTVDTSAGNR